MSFHGVDKQFQEDFQKINDEFESTLTQLFQIRFKVDNDCGKLLFKRTVEAYMMNPSFPKTPEVFRNKLKEARNTVIDLLLEKDGIIPGKPNGMDPMQDFLPTKHLSQEQPQTEFDEFINYPEDTIDNGEVLQLDIEAQSVTDQMSSKPYRFRNMDPDIAKKRYQKKPIQ